MTQAPWSYFLIPDRWLRSKEPTAAVPRTANSRLLTTVASMRIALTALACVICGMSSYIATRLVGDPASVGGAVTAGVLTFVLLVAIVLPLERWAGSWRT